MKIMCVSIRKKEGEIREKVRDDKILRMAENEVTSNKMRYKTCLIHYRSGIRH
jgi:hypothetical protein